jgi:hypothetical protein
MVSGERQVGGAGWVSFSKLRLFLKARSGTRIGNVRWKPPDNPRLSLDPKIELPVDPKYLPHVRYAGPAGFGREVTMQTHCFIGRSTAQTSLWPRL